ncbi:TPA: Arc family DNA-binding protein [Proteus mirabilis]|uniref:Arc family DNA-binding protein n=1 Tax=Proteus mirabilis TaxID=584 RepID=UPI001B3601A5|nr:Arc family DNA-binding protein [Proteus mirabilis]MBQ0619622.1 Arc family DNA-binding protein [Proteus mirabilis]MCJ2220429.1 Arc family DNA-binding protein [Proteus mirabilis]
MSREDPQLRIRLPIELKNRIEIVAKENSRSMNAEIVQRLEVSILNEMPSNNVISASIARDIANTAKAELERIIFKRTFDEINKKIRVGHTTFSIDLADLALDSDDFFYASKVTFDELAKQGYKTSVIDSSKTGFLIEIPDC